MRGVRAKLRFCSYYLKRRKQNKKESFNITWTYALQRDRHAAAPFLFRPPGDTTSRRLSEPRGSVPGRLETPGSCPVNKTHVWLQPLVTTCSSELKKCLTSLTRGHWHSKASSNFSNFDLLGSLYKIWGSECRLKVEDCFVIGPYISGWYFKKDTEMCMCVCWEGVCGCCFESNFFFNWF